MESHLLLIPYPPPAVDDGVPASSTTPWYVSAETRAQVSLLALETDDQRMPRRASRLQGRTAPPKQGQRWQEAAEQAAEAVLTRNREAEREVHTTEVVMVPPAEPTPEAVQKAERTKKRFKYHTLLERIRKGYRTDPFFQEVSNLSDFEHDRKTKLYTRNKRIVVPDVSSLKADILMEIHDSAYGGHQGGARTFEQLSRVFWWKGVREDVAQHVQCCPVCQRNKSLHTRPAGLLQPLQLPERRWGSINMDKGVATPQLQDVFCARAS